MYPTREPAERDGAVDAARRSTSAGSRPPRVLAPGPEPFRVEVHRRLGAARVAPIGELDLGTVPALARALDELTDSGFQSIVLDLGGLEFMDSTGLQLIVSFDRRARDREVQFALIQGPPQTQRLFQVTGTLGRLPFRSAVR